MQINRIVTAIELGKVNITAHARIEASNDRLGITDILFSARSGVIIEDYPNDAPYSSCLIYGNTKLAEPVHTVWAYDDGREIAILITVYRPDPRRWINWSKRR